jgi:sterol 3beta-glucosyltransferase
MPSYLITNEVHRQRDEIVGFGSGVSVASTVRLIHISPTISYTHRLQPSTDKTPQEFVLGIYEAFCSLVRHPYVGAKIEGPLGFPKGIGRGFSAFLCHLMAGKHYHNFKSLLSIQC